MKLELMKSYKIAFSLLAITIGTGIGFFAMIPMTRVDALIKQYAASQVKTKSAETVEPLIIPKAQSSDTLNPSQSQNSAGNNLRINLPQSYYTEPTSSQTNTASSAADSTLKSQSNTGSVESNQLIPTRSSSLSIPAINLSNVAYSQGSLQNISDIENKLLTGPVSDTAFNQEPCLPHTHSYLMGHSQPAYDWQTAYPSTSIFGNLFSLKPGDKIYVTNNASTSCMYEVTGWDKVVTDNDTVPLDVFNNLMYPDISSGSVLSIQTCQLGSTSIRLVLRAKMI